MEKNMSIRIRNVLLQDAEGIAGIIHDIGWFENLNFESIHKTAERVRKHISLCLSDSSHSIFAAEDESNMIVGYCSVHFLPYLFLTGPEGYVSELFISAKVRGQGIGTALLEQIKKEAKKRGCSRLSLINSRTRESYRRRFYERIDWKERTEVAVFVLPLM